MQVLGWSLGNWDPLKGARRLPRVDLSGSGCDTLFLSFSKKKTFLIISFFLSTSFIFILFSLSIFFHLISFLSTLSSVFFVFSSHIFFFHHISFLSVFFVFLNHAYLIDEKGKYNKILPVKWLDNQHKSIVYEYMYMLSQSIIFLQYFNLFCHK